MSENDSFYKAEEQRFREALSAIAEKDRLRRRTGMLMITALVLMAAVWLAISLYEVKQLNSEIKQLNSRVETLQKDALSLEAHTKDLTRTQEDLLDFLGGVASKEAIQVLDSGVDWPRTKAELLAIPAGPRKSALLSAILLAWKAVPFSMSNASLKQGLDSPHFIDLILKRYGVEVQQKTGERLSDAMMRTFERVAMPLPGDLIFYRGNVGSFVVMYIGPGKPEGKGVAVGTLQTGEELCVLDTASVNTPVYPFIGYFRVPYPLPTKP